MKLKRNCYFFVFVLLLAATVVGMSLTLPYLEVKLFPIIIGSVVFVLAALGLWREVVAKDKPPTAVRGEPLGIEARDVLRGFGPTLGWVVGFLLGVYLLGFLIAIPLFVLSYLRLRGRSWLIATGFAIVILAFVYGVFELGLKAGLYKGLLFPR